MKKPIPFKTLSEDVSVTLPNDHPFLNPSLRIGGNQNHIEIRDNKFFYHNVDITKDFLGLINSGFLDRFLPKIES